MGGMRTGFSADGSGFGGGHGSGFHGGSGGGSMLRSGGSARDASLLGGGGAGRGVGGGNDLGGLGGIGAGTRGARLLASGLSRGPMRGNGGRRRMTGGISRVSTAPVKARRRFLELFELGAVIGRGAMCAVHKCHLLSSGQTFAVKVFHVGGDGRPGESGHSVLQQLATEISTHRLLMHPNIVHLRACFQEADAMYVVMEHLAGGDLLDRILQKSNAGDPYGEPAAAHVMHSIFDALQYLHERQNIAHRDIKPENILLQSPEDDLTVKLADFGTASRLPGRRRAHSYTGSPQYMAPEVCATLNGFDMGHGYDCACDMWSAGVVLYILVCQGMPFSTDNADVEVSDEDATERMQREIQAGRYSMEPCDRLGLSDEVRDLITGLLCVDPTRRLTAAEALCHPWIARHLGGENASRLDS